MLKRFYFWVVLGLMAAIGSVTAIHWNALEGIRQRTAKVLPLYQRLKSLENLSLNLESYRRMSSNFRNLSPAEILEIKESLVKKFDDGIAQLDRLDPVASDHPMHAQLKKQLTDLLESIAEVEPTLFSRDAYVKPQIQSLHEDLTKTLGTLIKNTDTQVSTLHLDRTAPEESRSLALIIAVELVILALSLLLILKSYMAYQKPLKMLHQYAGLLKDGKPVNESNWHFKGLYDDIHSVLSKLSSEVDTLVKNRHRFILDIVDDLRAPLEMLGEGKLLLTADGSVTSSEQSFQSQDKVRRGLALFSGSLEDLNDIVGINQLQSRLSESTVDLSELLADVSQVLFGPEAQKRMVVSVPPIPVWVNLDVRRFERALFHMISKVSSTVSPQSPIYISVTHGKGGFRGIELVVQGSENEATGVPPQTGPEQDLLKHWISENGLSMRLVHKMIRSHGGSISAAGMVGSSVRIMIRIPHERVSTNGLIAPPSQAQGQRTVAHNDAEEQVAAGLVFKTPTASDSNSAFGS